MTVQALPAAFQRAQLATLQKDDLFYFLWRAFDVLHKDRGEAFVPNWHLEAMCWQLGRVAAGERRWLLITIPPRHLKTITTSVAFVAWLIGRDPALRIIIASYGHGLAQKNLGDLRRVLESDIYRHIFPGVDIHVSGAEIRTRRCGSIRATSVGGTITGIGADYIIGDDLMKAGDASSPQMREEAFNFYQHSLLSRLDNKSEGRIILVQQRLHADDVAGRLLDAGGFEHLNLPAITGARRQQLVDMGFANAPHFHPRQAEYWPLAIERSYRGASERLRLHKRSPHRQGAGSQAPDACAAIANGSRCARSK